MKTKLYVLLVNRHIGITERYHRFHDGATGIKKHLSWFYLLWLNFAYYILFCRFLGKKASNEIYEEKCLEIKVSESEKYTENNYSVETFVEKAIEYDVISFDIFDTLIFRPVAMPTDVFYMISSDNGIIDFKSMRAWSELDARIKHHDKYGNSEVDLAEIWKNLEEDVGISAEDGMSLEQQIEENICFANPFMKQVFDKLIKSDKKVIITSDMYLPQECIESILYKNGYVGYEKLYLSNVYQKSKADGTLYQEVLKDYQGQKIIHIGDNVHSDYDMARKAGLSALKYQNVNKNMLLYRAYDMSAIVGSGYRGIVSTYLYNGLNKYSMEYEYGFIYGGLFVLGYCHFIHEYVKHNSIDKVLFLSRDGDILKQIYDYLYPDDDSVYVYWSRKAATKMEALYDKHDYFRRFIYHKVNQNYTIGEVLKSMELDAIIDELGDWHEIWQKREDEESKQKYANSKQRKGFIALESGNRLTDENGYLLCRFIEAKWDKVLAIYKGQFSACEKYYRDIIGDSDKVVAVDIGWAGSGAITLSYLVEKVWKCDCTVTGIIAGTNTLHNSEPDASEAFLQSGKLVAYLYSQAHNRDLLKKHDPNKDYNVFWELLLSSPTPQFKGFYTGDTTNASDNNEKKYISNLDITLEFGKYDYNQEGIKEIQRGIIDFAHEYHTRFIDFPYMENISGRDAYAPMLVAASRNEKYLKAIEKKFKLEINVI